MTRRRLIPALVLYLAALAAAVPALVALRDHVVATFSQPEELRQWQNWREAAGDPAIQGPVARRKPSSEEPPALVLMRDYFPIVLAAALFFSSLVYWFLVLALCGAMSSSRTDRAGGNGRPHVPSPG